MQEVKSPTLAPIQVVAPSLNLHGKAAKDSSGTGALLGHSVSGANDLIRGREILQLLGHFPDAPKAMAKGRSIRVSVGQG